MYFLLLGYRTRCLVRILFSLIDSTKHSITDKTAQNEGKRVLPSLVCSFGEDSSRYMILVLTKVLAKFLQLVLHNEFCSAAEEGTIS